MASTDAADQVQHSLKEEPTDVKQTDLTSLKPSSPSGHGVSDAGKDAGEHTGEASPVPSSPASGLSTTKGGTQSPSVAGQAATPPLSMPHPKKFSHVNINKKFLEKTSASTPSHTLSSSPVTKSASTSQKPVLQTSNSHPRLVTAKLTATPQPSTTTGPGWSRPSSAVPSAASPVGSSKASPAPIAPPGGTAVPPPGGKVIQPQPRASSDAVPQRRDTSTRPVWGNAKGSAVNSSSLDGAPSDFPTAAEVAQAGRAAKGTDKPVSSDAATVHKQTVMAELAAEEDTFRGVHLDPNAHHWDEMEEDDDNFLGGVIEFEDGRQYKVQATDPSQQLQLDPKQPLPQGGSESRHAGLSDQPVSKEDRFADDFDRSWPRSRPLHHAPGQHRDQRQDGIPTSPATSSHSPQESSRVLFNERSNRLEPYSHQRHGTPGVPFNRRGSRSEHGLSPTEPRRDAPPHTHTPGVQLLQKGPHHDGSSFSKAPGDRTPLSPQDGSRFRERPPFQREHNAWQGSGPQGPDHGRHNGPFGSPQMSRHVPLDDRTRRPGPETPSTPGGSDHRRQLPPHLAALSPRHPPAHIEDHVPIQPSPTPSSHRELAPPSASSQVAPSPVVSETALPTPTTPAADMEDARKLAMHAAAERAKLRRQREEEEREKERERARRKAAELEEKIKAMEQDKAREREKAEAEKRRTEDEAVGFIENAVSSLDAGENKPANAEVHPQRHLETRPSMGRTPSARGGARPFSNRRTSFTPSTHPASPVIQPSTASETESWRRKNPPSSAASVQAESEKSPAPLAPLLPPSVFSHADLEVKAGEEVEVIDFSDHGKLAGPEAQPHDSVASNGRPPRAVASDYFSDAPVPPQHAYNQHVRAEEDPWRRASAPSRPVTHQEDGKPGGYPAQFTSYHQDGSFQAAAPHSPAHDDHARRMSSHYQNGVLRPPPLGPSYREAPMSTLNDVISRIKGALDGMHHEAEPPKPPKWLPPALRSKPAQPDFAPLEEVFDVTSAEPPKSPKPAWNVFHVKLPHVTREVAAPPRTELVWPRGVRSFRLEVYSFNPPVEVLSRREGTVNDAIFSRPRLVRGQPKYYVSIPRRRINPRTSTLDTSASPVVNIPSTPTRPRVPPLPKESAASAASTWRKPPPSPTAARRPEADELPQQVGLNTVSRSPPPVVPSGLSAAPSLPKAIDSVAVSSPAAPSVPLKVKTEPKMPAGSDVAFYRNARVETPVESHSPVQFIVTSELESQSRRPSNAGTPTEVQPMKSADIRNGTVVPASQSERTQGQGAPNTRGITNGVSTPPIEPQSNVSPWSKSPKAFALKDSPARAPDPEHLKAVWSQTPEKAQIQPVNSLKGIADDLTGVPFTLQDVKSDDGGTPPPSGSGTWSRMSSHEVTRAFQQVPSSSSSSSQRPAPIASTTSSSTNGSATRHPGFAFSPPPMAQPGLRPGYPTYSPMLSHSPSPTVMYPQASPVPRPMVVNGGAPAYGQAVWMPAMPGAAPPAGGMMRSPYPQMMPYPSPGGGVPMYAQPMPMQNAPQQNGVQGRPPSMAMMSPVMQPAMAQMYPSSPMLVQTPIMPPGQGYPMPSNQGNRAPMRPYDQNPANGAQMLPPPMRQPPQNGYNPIPSNYARPPW
ncbi:hypothetical protein BD413DRAFT_128083 [Trametes elegans]|nr:hypothetical protein BD413DRAFT_128083 [Trametes elegans]